MKAVILSILTLTQPLFAAQIRIDADEYDCVDGWLSMDVEIRVDGESFDFNPSCSFSFRERIETFEGVRCEVEAGMCSGFSPEHRLEVECDDGSDEWIHIRCP